MFTGCVWRFELISGHSSQRQMSVRYRRWWFLPGRFCLGIYVTCIICVLVRGVSREGVTTVGLVGKINYTFYKNTSIKNEK